jgi:cell division protein FtsB
MQAAGMPLLDRLLRGRAWVALVGVLLAGIVFLNVSVLELNRGIAATDAQSASLERVNSSLRERVAKLDSGERIRQLAAAHGFVMPQPGDVHYIRPSSRSDTRLALARMTPPSSTALASTSTSTASTSGATGTTPPSTTTITTSTTATPVAPATPTATATSQPNQSSQPTQAAAAQPASTTTPAP